MYSDRTLSTKEKALRINLDRSIYGSFAEIGAGQEVAANFFKAGGASGTIAKTMSAYDMSFSDAIYGKSERYVCEPRLVKMLEHEYELLEERLKHRAEASKFFAFANTVEALNFQKTNRGHGWLGLRFQLRSGGKWNQCIIHVNLHDNDNIRQQEAIGILGVNLLYGCYFFNNNTEGLMHSLVDNLFPGSVEIDMLRLKGPDFDHIDNRLLSLKLVKNGLTKAAMFGPDGNVMQPSEALYKKHILAIRGRFRPVTLVNVDMIIKGFRQFKMEADIEKKDISILVELTLQDLKSDNDEINDLDFLNRVDILCSMGQNVMISNYYEYFRLVDYLTSFSKNKKIGMIVGINNLTSIFTEAYYQGLKGGILEAFGELFGHNIKLYVYPANKNAEGELYTTENIAIPQNLRFLFEYLRENGKIEDIKQARTEILGIISDKVLLMIKNGEEGWESMVPVKVSKAIKEKYLFDYKPVLQKSNA
jgi:hypothetical protein